MVVRQFWLRREPIPIHRANTAHPSGCVSYFFLLFLLFAFSFRIYISVPHRSVVCAPLQRIRIDHQFDWTTNYLNFYRLNCCWRHDNDFFSHLRCSDASDTGDANGFFFSIPASPSSQPIHRFSIQLIMWLKIIINIYARLCCRCHCWPSAAYRLKRFHVIYLFEGDVDWSKWHSWKRYALNADTFYYFIGSRSYRCR